jgi:hypothetical protein
MGSSTAVDARLGKLERDNLRLKLVVGSLLVTLGVLPLIGAAPSGQMPNVIEARSFHVIDENGIKRAQVDADGIFYIDADSNVRLSAYADGIYYMDETGRNRVLMGPNGIEYMDENGLTRAHLGRIAFNPPATDALTYYPGDVALYDAEGNLRWRALR